MSLQGRMNHIADLTLKETEAATDVQDWDVAPLVSDWPIMVAELDAEDQVIAGQIMDLRPTHRIRCGPHGEIKAGRLWKSQTDGSEYLILRVTRLRGHRKLMSMYVNQITEAQW